MRDEGDEACVFGVGYEKKEEGEIWHVRLI